MNFRPFSLGIVAVAAILVSGCLESRMPLFDEAKAVMPAQAGRYDEQEFKDGEWVSREKGTLMTQGRAYSWKPDGREGIEFFTVHEVGGDFFMIAVRENNPKPEIPYSYALFEKTSDGFLGYQPTCSDLMKMRLPKEDLPTINGSECFFNDREALVRSLTYYAKIMLPGSRYVLLKQ